MIQPTSRDSYERLTSIGERARLKREIFEYLKKNGASTNRRIANDLHLELSTSGARVRELVIDGLVEKSGKVLSETNIRVFTWKVREGQLSFI